MPTLPRLWIPFALLGLLSLTFSGTPAWSRPPDPEAPPEVLPACTDVLRCQLAREIALTDRFLRERRYGLPFTLDPRPLDYPLEMLRLNVMSQAMGYLNLYRTGHRAEHRREALARLEYLLALGDIALGNGPRDGMYGYLMLDAYDLLREERFLAAGRRAGERCVRGQTDFNLTMNGGLMCALNHAFLARLDGSETSAAIADGIVDRTAPKQFEDGAFPHQPFLASGRNTNYSAWMANELLMLRSLRPALELTEYLAVNTIEFLQRRVGPDGLLVYRDSLFDYASDPGGGDTRGWTSELASVGLDLAVSGHRDDAARVLSRLFAMRLKGEDLGGYPDKYAYIERAKLERTQLMALVSQCMRCVLVDHARARAAAKRPSSNLCVTLADAARVSDRRFEGVLDLHLTLERFAGTDARAAQVTEMMIFGAFTQEEVAAHLRLSDRTVREDFAMGKAWMRREWTGGWVPRSHGRRSAAVRRAADFGVGRE